MNKARRMLLYPAIGLLAVLIGLVAYWYVQTRNVEVARYSVAERDGDIEIRDYPVQVVAEVTRSGDRDQAVRAGFGPLARYIFASDRGGEKIAMTAPVTQQAQGPSWTVQFIMPSGHDLASLPKPAGGDVVLGSCRRRARRRSASAAGGTTSSSRRRMRPCAAGWRNGG